MPTPTKINDHSDSAIARLTQHFRDKRLINALFRSKSSARIDVIQAEADTYWVSINGVIYTFSGATFIYDDPGYSTTAQIATQLVDAINGATTESFELFTTGQEFGGEGVHGIWTPDANGFPGTNLGGFIVEDTEAKQGLKGIRTDLSQGLPVSSQPQPLFAANIADYINIANDDQIGNIWFKIPLAFPGPSLKGQGALVGIASFIWINSTYSLNAALIYEGPVTYAFKLEIGYFGQPALLSFTIPEAYLIDGNWHLLEIGWDHSGTYVSLDLDSGAYGGSTSLGLSPTGPTSLFLLNVFTNNITSPISDVPDIYYDNLEIGQSIVSDATAYKLSEDDDYLYLKTKTAGEEIDITTSDNLSTRRIGVIDQIQEIEDVLYDGLLYKRSLAEAEGVQLDKIGEILGLVRQGGWDDEEYRILLGVQIGINLSNGEPERMVNTLDALVDSNFIKLAEFFPAAVEMRFDGTPVNPSLIAQQMQLVKPAGVRLDLINVDPVNPFATEGYGGNGFGDAENPGLGGLWAGAI